MRFTNKSIAALKPKAARYEVWEDGRTGLGVRIAPTGRKSWLYMYRFEGRPRRMTLGVYPRLGLADAHVLHANARKTKEGGVDPGAVLVEQKRAERHAETVKDLINEYLERYARPNKRSATADERALKKEVEPLWGNRKAKSITRRDVIKLLDDIVTRGSPVMANRLLEMIRRMFAFAVERDTLETSPCQMVKAPAKETSRDRVLTSVEIQTFSQGLHKANMSSLTALSLRLMLVTAQRRAEIVAAPWVEFDLGERVWEIPAGRTKTGNTHRVPLSPMALDLLADIREASKDSPWLFPSPKDDKPMDPAVVSHAVRNTFQADAERKENGQDLVWSGLGRLTPHDLRRTAASHMTEIGISRLVVSKILAHVDSSTTGVYDRYEYWPEKCSAMNAWASRLQEIISAEPNRSNVVPLAAGTERR